MIKANLTYSQVSSIATALRNMVETWKGHVAMFDKTEQPGSIMLKVSRDALASWQKSYDEITNSIEVDAEEVE